MDNIIETIDFHRKKKKFFATNKELKSHTKIGLKKPTSRKEKLRPNSIKMARLGKPFQEPWRGGGAVRKSMNLMMVIIDNLSYLGIKNQCYYYYFCFQLHALDYKKNTCILLV